MELLGSGTFADVFKIEKDGKFLPRNVVHTRNTCIIQKRKDCDGKIKWSFISSRIQICCSSC